MIAKTPEDDPNVVTIENTGPVEHLEFAPQPGKVTILRGPNGTGKSTVLKAVTAIATKRNPGLTSRDGTVGGFVKAFGATIKVTRNGQNRRLNDCVVAAVEDGIDIASFVDPGLKDEAAADLRRIKALCNLVGATVKLEDLYDLVGGREAFESVVEKKSMAIEDPIQLVEAVKRDFEAAARMATNAATNAHQAAVAKLAENEGIDLSAPSDATALQQTLSDAISRRSRWAAERSEWSSAHNRAEQAQLQLDKVTAGYTGPSVEKAEKDFESVRDQVRDQVRAVEELQRRLADAERELALIRQEEKTASAQLDAARSHQAAIEGWQQTINAAPKVCPVSDMDLQAAEEEVQQATRAVETGARVRDAQRRADEAAKREDEATEHRNRAEKYRSAAQATLDVLAESVRQVSERIDFDSNFRLVVKHPQRQNCYFAELSHGERWALAIDMALEAAIQRGEKCILGIPQEAFEAMDADNRELIAQHIAGKDVIVITAEASKTAEECDVGLHVAQMEPAAAGA